MTDRITDLQSHAITSERIEAMKTHVYALGELIDAEDAATGQGAATYASVTFAIRDVYRDLRTARTRHEPPQEPHK